MVRSSFILTEEPDLPGTRSRGSDTHSCNSPWAAVREEKCLLPLGPPEQVRRLQAQGSQGHQREQAGTLFLHTKAWEETSYQPPREKRNRNPHSNSGT